MRSMFRSVLVTLVAVLAVGAVASASALAAPNWEVQEGGVWKALGTGESRNIVATGGAQVLHGSGLSAPEETRCEEVKGKGKIENTSTGGMGVFETFTYTKCKVIKPAGCALRSRGAALGTIELKPSATNLVEFEGGGVGDLFKAQKEPLAELEMREEANPENGCGILPLAPEKVTGQVVAKVEANGKLHFTTPEQVGSNLKCGSSAFRIVGEVSQELEGGGAIRAS